MLEEATQTFLIAARTGTEARSVRPIAGRGLIVERAGRRLLDVEEIELSGSGISVVMGANGSGKSLLLRVLAGLVAPDRGRVFWGTSPPGRERALKLGFVFQKPVMLRRSAEANILYALGSAGVPAAERGMRALSALEEAGLSHLARVPARVLSGGEQQRLALARALSIAPEVLFLDEPTASADPASTASIEAMARHAQARGAKVVLVTHDVGQARRLAGDVVFLHAGRIAERAPAGSFFSAPSSAPARAYLEGRLFL